MRLAARFVATVAVAFLMVPALYADHEQSGAEAKKAETAAAIPAPTGFGEARWNSVAALPLGFSTSRQSEAGAFARPVGAMRTWGEPGDYTPKFEWFLGYSFWRAVPTSNGNRMGYLHGGSTSIAYNLNRYLGLVGDFGGYANNRLTLYSPATSLTVDSDGRAFTYLFGPRLSYRRYERFTPFVQVLFGAAHASPVRIAGCTGSALCTPLGSENAFAMTAGGGFDVALTRHIALRLIQAEYLMTRFRDLSSSTGDRGTQNNVRLSTGIVFRFGGNPARVVAANLPPVATCSANNSVAYIGSENITMVRAEASDPDNDPLTYSWSSNGGAVEGNGPDARWNSSGTVEGTYTVKARVDDGRGGTADCSVNIRVEPQPNRPPTISCSPDRSPIQQGESTDITAVASDPDDDPLTFSYTSTGGRIAGSGAKVRFDSMGLAVGSYTINCSVSDGRGAAADASADVAVEASPEIHELESRLSLHSIYFATARPTENNPGGGLLESQADILTALADDFNKYLSFKPDAHLILGGHADVRGTADYNKALTQRRVERTKSFLVEHGVPADNIGTQSFGEEDQLTAEQVKEQIANNPDLSPDERRQMSNQLRVIVLANNRRVDVTLSTTGQQSLRRYPFNARDALALISTKGGKREPAAKRRHKRQ